MKREVPLQMVLSVRLALDTYERLLSLRRPDESKSDFGRRMVREYIRSQDEANRDCAQIR